MNVLRAAFALIVWMVIWIPTTAFVVFVLLRDILRGQQKKARQSAQTMPTAGEASNGA